jgi:hypothetical protein
MAIKLLPRALVPVLPGIATPVPSTQAPTVYEFYLMYDQAIVGPLRQLKISTFDEKTTTTLKRIIDVNAN